MRPWIPFAVAAAVLGLAAVGAWRAARGEAASVLGMAAVLCLALAFASWVRK